MKKQNYLFAIIATILISCGSTNPANLQSSAGNEFKEVNDPLSDKQFKSDKDFLRARGVSDSPDEQTAEDKARIAAMATLGGYIKTKLSKAAERYVNEKQVSKSQEFSADFNQNIVASFQITLTDVEEVATKKFRSNDGTYKFYIVLAISKEKLLDGVNKSISRDAKLQLLYDKTKFKETFEKEMAELKNSN